MAARELWCTAVRENRNGRTENWNGNGFGEVPCLGLYPLDRQNVNAPAARVACDHRLFHPGPVIAPWECCYSLYFVGEENSALARSTFRGDSGILLNAHTKHTFARGTLNCAKIQPQRKNAQFEYPNIYMLCLLLINGQGWQRAESALKSPFRRPHSDLTFVPQYHLVNIKRPAFSPQMRCAIGLKTKNKPQRSAGKNMYSPRM